MADQLLVVDGQTPQLLEVAQQGPPGPAGPAGPAGPQGPAGPPGSGGDLSYVHTQSVAAAVWTITHNLGKYPSVSVVDSALTAWIGDVTYTNANSLTVTFGAAFAGSAYLN